MKKRFNFIQAFVKTMAFAFVVMLTLSSCNKEDNGETNSTEIEKIAITPKDASMAVGEQEDFSAYALTTDGDTLYFNDLDVDSHWWSSDTTVFQVQENGLATGKNTGDAWCILEATVTLKSAQLKALRFYTGRDSAFVSIH